MKARTLKAPSNPKKQNQPIGQLIQQLLRQTNSINYLSQCVTKHDKKTQYNNKKLTNFKLKTINDISPDNSYNKFLIQQIMRSLNSQSLTNLQYIHILQQICPQLLIHNEILQIVTAVSTKITGNQVDCLSVMGKYVVFLNQMIKTNSHKNTYKLCRLLTIMIKRFLEQDKLYDYIMHAVVTFRDYISDVVMPILISKSHQQQLSILHQLFLCSIVFCSYFQFFESSRVYDHIRQYIQKYGFTTIFSLDVLKVISDEQFVLQVIQIYEDIAHYWLNHVKSSRISDMEIHNFSILITTYPNLPKSIRQIWIKLLLAVSKQTYKIIKNTVKTYHINHQVIYQCGLGLFEDIIRYHLLYHNTEGTYRICALFKELKLEVAELLGLLMKLRQWITKIEIGYNRDSILFATKCMHMETEQNYKNIHRHQVSVWLSLKYELISVFLKYDKYFHELWPNSKQMFQQLKCLQLYCLEYWHQNKIEFNYLTIQHQQLSDVNMQLCEIAVRYHHFDMVFDLFNSQSHISFVNAYFIDNICKMAIQNNFVQQIWEGISKIFHKCFEQCIQGARNTKCDHLLLLVMVYTDIERLKAFNIHSRNILIKYFNKYYLNIGNIGISKSTDNSWVVILIYAMVINGIHIDIDISNESDYKSSKQIIIYGLANQLYPDKFLMALGAWLSAYEIKKNEDENTAWINCINRKIIIKIAANILSQKSHYDDKWKQYLRAKLKLFYVNINNSIIRNQTKSSQITKEMQGRQGIRQSLTDHTCIYSKSVKDLLKKYLPFVIEFDEFSLRAPSNINLQCINNRARRIYLVPPNASNIEQ